MKLKLSQLDSLCYNPETQRITFFTNLNGCDIPVSEVPKDLGDTHFFSTKVPELTSMTGVTLTDIHNGQTIH